MKGLDISLDRENVVKYGWRHWFNIDWPMFVSAVLLSVAGLVTMNSFLGTDTHFNRQLIWLIFSIVVFFLVSLIDFRFLRRTYIVTGLYLFFIFLLLALFGLGVVSKGAQSWFNLGFMSFQPADPVKLVIIILLAKYFSRRHIEIANIRHIIVSGLYAFLAFLLILLQPDFGSASIIFCIWLGMVLISGISKRHLLLVFTLGILAFSFLWFGVFQDYQKARIKTFISPLSDIRKTGYSAYQSTIAIGSGEVMGKGIGYGTQSKLKFLPEYQTDFIFSAFAEEWGFIGGLIIFGLYILLIFRILIVAYRGDSNFEILFGGGLAILIISHFIINTGMTIGLLPVTGVTLPFMSYGGTNLLTNFIGLGMLNGMRRYQKAAHKDKMKNEFLGL
jgi:rod shape determining protein RodA